MTQDRYPRVSVDLKKLEHNLRYVTEMCNKQGINVTGVIKGFNASPECIDTYIKAGCKVLASSRRDQLKKVKAVGDIATMLIRIPMMSEIPDVIEVADISLNSEKEILEALNEEAGRQGKKHKVVIMADLGDLREGFWEKDEMIKTALDVESEMPNLELAGVGTNLGCYGSIAPTADKLQELVAIAEQIEAKIGRKLEYVSGGASTSLPRIIEGDMPEGINNLRVGEGIILAKDLQDLWGYDMSDMYQNVFTLQAEIIELKDKPSYPVGEIMFDAFGNKPEYVDKGMRRKVLIGIGKVDYGYCEEIIPRDKNIEILGASSDHTIIDITESDTEYKIGDIMEFDLTYPALVFVTNCPGVGMVYLH